MLVNQSISTATAQTIAPAFHGMSPSVSKPISFPGQAHNLTDLEVEFDASQSAVWQYMNPHRRPSFTRELLKDLNKSLDNLQSSFSLDGHPPVKHLILASRIPGIFNLGGDLDLFLRLIQGGDHAGLTDYAHACIDVQYRRAAALGLPIHTIALVQGDALGGGFEAALACDAIVAERGVKFGLPEVLFDLFPGMGAYTFLSRKVGTALAERMMLDGRMYTAEELHGMGIIDWLAEPGQGHEAVHDYLHNRRRAEIARDAVAKLRRMVAPIKRQELMDITDLWVDTCLLLGPKDLRKMEHLCQAQNRRWAKMTSERQAG